MKKIAGTLVEFIPHIMLLQFWYGAGLSASLSVQNRPGITMLGLITIPSIILIAIAVFKTIADFYGQESGYNPFPRIHIEKNGFLTKFNIIVYSIVILVTLISTYLHYYQPETFAVPDNSNAIVWKHPAFEETAIYERMIQEERTELLSKGVPGHKDIPANIAFDLIIALFGILCFIHAVKYYGRWMASCFLMGSFIFTGLQESMWILLGRLVFGGNVHNGIGETFTGTYWFTNGGLWFIQCPFRTCVAWFFIAYSCVFLVTKVFPKKSLLWRAALGGMVATNIDMWVDPVATSPEYMHWVWGTGDVITFFGIPLYNFLAWFLIVSVFAVIWELLPGMKEKWGELKASINFFLIILVADLAVLFILIGYHVVAGSIFAVVGIDHVIQIPKGW